ncbi:MAG: GGDEF domain-containing protein [bacterium]|nr:GGDEF domain-containing protein [bacterium]
MATKSDPHKDMPQKAPTPPDSLERAQGIAISALEKLEALNLKPIPPLYELWYRYFEGDPEIVRAVDSYTGIFDENTCHKLYKRFLGPGARDEAVRKVSDQVQLAITELATMLGSVKTATTEYGENLGDVSSQIANAESIADLGAVVSSIIQETKVMVAKNQQLESKLETSSEQVTELKKNLDNVKREALTDGLTGVANRKAFDKNILDMIEESTANATPMVLIMIDIDFFKKFNDTYGHQVGDQVLKLVARTLVDNVKGRDLVSRYGGEEFSVLLPETPLSAGMKVGEMLRRSVESKEVVNKTSNENLGRITLSIGVAEYLPGESISRVIERADEALYKSKKTGRNRVSAAEHPENIMATLQAAPAVALKDTTIKE